MPKFESSLVDFEPFKEMAISCLLPIYFCVEYTVQNLDRSGQFAFQCSKISIFYFVSFVVGIKGFSPIKMLTFSLKTPAKIPIKYLPEF